MQRRRIVAALGALSGAGLTGTTFNLLAQRTPDVIFVPTAFETVIAMLKLAEVSDKDIVYDLGCGDGRFVVTAAQQFGARGVGVDIDPERIKEARELAKRTGADSKVRFIEGDLFETDISEATVVTLYLLTRLNLKLRPKLMKELIPGTRIVSHAFDMGDWKPEKTANVSGSPIYLWRIPARG
jgi:SAM-dependent methyltransferase